jgi:hypothetical protein
MEKPIKVELTAEPRTVSEAARDQFLVGVVVENLGKETLDPDIDHSHLTVNGQPATSWNLALGNSGHLATWNELPPGKSVSGKWRLGKALFPAPGDYTLVLTVSGVAAAPITIHVTR